MDMFSGLDLSMGNLPRISSARSRSISAENKTGGKGQGAMAVEGTGASGARDLGVGWKISPSVVIPPGMDLALGEISEPGAIQHIWLTAMPSTWRSLILRTYWDGEAEPSVEVPLGDFFCNGWGVRCNVNSLPIAVNPAGGMNSYWVMPFRQSARVSLENLAAEPATVYYQIDYALTEVPDDVGYFHAEWRRSNPLPYKEAHTIVDGVRGRGHYVGTYLAWQSNSTGWWGEGEVKFYLDGDQEFPTICGTGTEDYFGGAWNFEDPKGQYSSYSTSFLGLPQVIRPDGLYRSQQRFGMYRWHIPDPVRFEQDLRVTIQGLGWRSEGRYLPLMDDVASVAYWYQTEPHADHRALPGADGLEVI